MAGVMLALSTPFSAFAQSTPDEPEQQVSEQSFTLWADGNAELATEGEHAIDAVRWLSSADMNAEITRVGETAAHYYLMLPATADISKLTLWHSFSEDPIINGVTVKNGEVTTAFTEAGDYKMTAEGKELTLTVMQSRSIGTMFINTETGDMNKVHANKENKVSGDIVVVDPDGKQSYSGALSYIKGRGNTTWKNLKKKPYNIKLDKKAALLGMDESKKWCLLANAQDHSMLRNKIAYDLADEIGLDYSPDSQFTDLYLNGEYAGVYQLTEKVEAGKNNLVKIADLEGNTEKVNEKDLDKYPQVKPETTNGSKKYYDIPSDPKDITGGYLLEFDTREKYDGEASGFVTNRGQCVVVKSPEYATKAQVEYISEYVQDMEDAIYSVDGKNSKGRYYTEYLDIESAALMYLVQEYSLNIDCAVTSFFLFKDSDEKGDGKIHTAPVWDFDVAFGNLDTKLDDTHAFNDPDFMYAAAQFEWGEDENLLFSQLYTYRDFADTVKKLYNEKFKPALDILNSKEAVSGKYIKSIPAYKEMLDPSVLLNFIRWRIKDTRLVSESGKTFDEQIAYLSDFTSKRAAFFEESFKDKAVSDDFCVYFTNYNEEDPWKKVYIYYTGTDSSVEWPGVEMKPLEYYGWEHIYKADLGALGVKDDGYVHVTINDGKEHKTRCIGVRNDTITVRSVIYFHGEEEGEYDPRPLTLTGSFSEDNFEYQSYIIGDVDGDGVVTANDALKLLRYSAEVETPPSREEYYKALIDSDNQITSADALYVLRNSVGLTDDVVSLTGKKVGEKFEYYDYNGDMSDW